MLLKSNILMRNQFVANVGASSGEQMISNIGIVHRAFLFILGRIIVETFFLPQVGMWVVLIYGWYLLNKNWI